MTLDVFIRRKIEIAVNYSLSHDDFVNSLTSKGIDASGFRKLRSVEIDFAEPADVKFVCDKIREKMLPYSSDLVKHDSVYLCDKSLFINRLYKAKHFAEAFLCDVYLQSVKSMVTKIKRGDRSGFNARMYPLLKMLQFDSVVEHDEDANEEEEEEEEADDADEADEAEMNFALETRTCPRCQGGLSEERDLGWDLGGVLMGSG